ncbi:MAG: hypothetical protein K2H64_04200 [Desulfovibrio sp.]|nr:hypothetical protein [Desulfovibrio sp.]
MECDAKVVNLPATGLPGHTQFPLSDKNNAEVAKLLSHWLKEKGLN